MTPSSCTKHEPIAELGDEFDANLSLQNNGYKLKWQFCSKAEYLYVSEEENEWEEITLARCYKEILSKRGNHF